MSDSDTSPGEFGKRRQPPTPLLPKTASEALRPRGRHTAAAPLSRASRNQLVVFLNFVVSMVMLMVLAAGGAVFLGKRAFEGPGPTKVATTFLVKPNTGVSGDRHPAGEPGV